MPIFVSYSHDDSEFADALARNLVLHRRRVWIDKWELNVGDSLITRIQSALEDASALLVILSESSTASEWCKKEISAGLLRELEERQVLVLPLVLGDCKIPLLLRDKVYADFRGDFDSGFSKVLEATAPLAGNPQGQLDDGNYKVDWALDWRVDQKGDERNVIWTLTSVAHSVELPFSVLTETLLIGDSDATRRFLAYSNADLHWIAERELLNALLVHLEADPYVVVLKDNRAQHRGFELSDDRARVRYLGMTTVRWLGVDTGRDVVVYVDQEIRRFATDLISRSREPTVDEHSRFLEEFTRV